MPLYDYRCSQCGHVVEVRHGFDETYREPCPHCASALIRVFNPASIVFKGSGFYVTDSRKSAEKTASQKSPETKAAETKAAETKAPETKPAAENTAPKTSEAAKPSTPPTGESAA